MFEEENHQSKGSNNNHQLSSLTEGLRNMPEMTQSSKKWVWFFGILALLMLIGSLGLFVYSQHQINPLWRVWP